MKSQLSPTLTISAASPKNSGALEKASAMESNPLVKLRSLRDTVEPKKLLPMKTSLLALSLVFAFAVSARAELPAGWTDNYAKALETAKAENKNLLLDFTGSDWCGFCKLLDKEVFSTPHFKNWAKKNVVLVQVDFPRSTPLSPELQAQNNELKNKYPLGGYPTIVILDNSGNVLTKKVGYHPGSGPMAYVKELEAGLKK